MIEMKIIVKDEDVLYGIEQAAKENKDGKDVLKMLEKNSSGFYSALAVQFVAGAKLKGGEKSIMFQEELSNILSLFRFGLATLYSAVGKKEIKIAENKVDKILSECGKGTRDSNLESELMRRIENTNEQFAESFGHMMRQMQLHGFSSYVLALMLIAVLNAIEESDN